MFGLVNIVKKPTCNTIHGSSLIDVILTNKPQFMKNTNVFPCSVSDCHCMIMSQLKVKVPCKLPKTILYRSLKTFNKADFVRDIEDSNLSRCLNQNSINNAWKMFNDSFAAHIDTHAPIKRKNVRAVQPPFMNSELRKAIMHRNKLHNIYLKCKTSENWENYRKQRNLCVSIRRKNCRAYFYNHCKDGPAGGAQFWKAVKPFLSSKGGTQSGDIVLNENGSIVNKTSKIVEIFNDYYVNIASDLGANLDTQNFDDHPSIKSIKENSNSGLNNLTFSATNCDEVAIIIKKLNPKKATGYDQIPARFVKAASGVIAPILSNLINLSITQGVFPNCLKKAEVTPVYKKSDKLNKGNYRPVSILPVFSKIFEKVLEKQISLLFGNIFSSHLSAFRKGFSCQDVLLALIESWKKSLREGLKVGNIMMDLSKAFDCMSHPLLASKLSAYGFQENSVRLITSYLSNREQRVKLGNTRSTWLPISKGVPQGSILGPVLFNIFINDIFYFINKATLTNYADDNTLTFADSSEVHIRQTLVAETNIAIEWFSQNCLAANPDKFQALFIGKNFTQDPVNIQDFKITPEKNVKLLGVVFDKMLNFNDHITELCQKTCRQLNALKRLTLCLSTASKLAIFRSYVISYMSYCSIIWHFCGKTNSKKIEKIQERALRTVFLDYYSSYSDLLSKANTNTLKEQRLRDIIITVYKILHNSAPEYLNNLVTPRTCTHKTRYGINSLTLPSMSVTKYGLNSFMYIAPRLWNSLDQSLKNSKTLKQFKIMIRNETLEDS